MPTHRKKSTAKKVYPSPLTITPTQLNNDLCLQYAYLYAKPKRQQRMDTKTVCQMQELIGVKMREPDGNILDDAFITNFRLLKDIDANIFRSMTKTLFKALVSQPIRYPFLTKLTTEWLEYANHTSMATKERFFMENLSIFQTMAQFIPKIGCYSLQVRILKIIFSHLKSPQEYVKVLFKPLIEDHPHGIFCRLESYNTLSDRQKQIIMYRDIPNDLNKKAKRVFSKVLRYLYFDNKAIAPYPSHEGFSDWNLGTKTIEFSLNLSGFEAKTMIDSDNLESVQYAIGPRHNQVHEITFTLSEPLNLSCDSNPSLSGRRSVAKVKMMFDTLEAHEVEKLFFKMFPNLATFKKDGQVKMAKPALHTVRDTHMGEVFISTPPSSPPRPFRKLRGSPKDIDPSEYFKNTEYSIDQDEHQPVQLELKHSDSEVEPPVKANDEPNQKQVTPTRSTEKQTTRKPSKQKQSKKTADDTVVSN
ncbi:uncharacterized protein LOC129572306, partial [Sitodiplosis mosellana]|uniref:uncharacterized protein LOC129572306 n=1 Tax=Sitodiplosis mosellana TaxID=263140 RepID=UPI002443ED21